MCGDLIEQQDGRNAGHRGDEAGMRQHQPDEQRLLLAGRGFAGGDSLGTMGHQQVSEVRPIEGAAGGSVARPAGAQGRAIAVL